MLIIYLCICRIIKYFNPYNLILYILSVMKLGLSRSVLSDWGSIFMSSFLRGVHRSSRDVTWRKSHGVDSHNSCTSMNTIGIVQLYESQIGRVRSMQWIAEKYVHHFREGDYLKDPREDNIKIDDVEVITFRDVDRICVTQDEQWRTIRSM